MLKIYRLILNVYQVHYQEQLLNAHGNQITYIVLLLTSLDYLQNL